MGRMDIQLEATNGQRGEQVIEPEGQVGRSAAHADDAAPAPMRGGRRAITGLMVQVLGFAIGVALLVWCARKAFSPENRVRLERLWDASMMDVALLLGLSAALLAIDAAIFWVILRPVRRLDPIGVQATNAVATFLGLLPFKLGMLFRVASHQRRDGVALAVILVWFASFAVLMLTGLVPLVVAALVAKQINTVWAGVVVGAMALLVGAIVVSARLFAGERGQARLLGSFGRLGVFRRFLETKLWKQLHAAFDMLSDARVVSIAVGLRVLYVAVLAGQFFLASRMLREPMAPDRALMLASTYYVVGAASPAGQVGTREGATAWLAKELNLGDPGGGGGGGVFAAIPLFVTSASVLVQLPLAGLGLLYLRPDRWWKRGGGAGSGERGRRGRARKRFDHSRSGLIRSSGANSGRSGANHCLGGPSAAERVDQAILDRQPAGIDARRGASLATADVDCAGVAVHRGGGECAGGVGMCVVWGEQETHSHRRDQPRAAIPVPVDRDGLARLDAIILAASHTARVPILKGLSARFRAEHRLDESDYPRRAHRRWRAGLDPRKPPQDVHRAKPPGFRAKHRGRRAQRLLRSISH